MVSLRLTRTFQNPGRGDAKGVGHLQRSKAWRTLAAAIGGLGTLGLAAIAPFSGNTSAEPAKVTDGWWSPGDGRTFAAFTAYPNATGLIGIVN